MIDPYALGILFAIASMIGYGSYQFFLNRCVREINILSSLILVHIFLILFTLPLLFFYEFVMLNIQIFMLILLTSLIGALNLPFLFKAVKLGKLSIVIPLANTYSFFTVIFSFLFFGEVLKSAHYLFGLVIIIGMFFIVSRRDEIRRLDIDRKDLKPIAYALIFSAGLGLYSVLLKPIELSIGPIYGTFYTEFFILILLLAYYFFNNMEFDKPDPKLWKFLILAGLFQAVGSIGFFYGIKYSNVSITSIIGTANPLITLSLAFSFLKERIEWNQFLGIVITLVGLIGIAL